MTLPRLAALLEDAARGAFPEPDGSVAAHPAPAGPAMAVVAFTAHHVIAATVAEAWVREQLPDGDLRTPMSPRFRARPRRRGRCTGRGQTPRGTEDVLFAQAAPGNAASLRALLSAGFRPIGSEVLFF